MKFYICEHCGNLVTMVKSSGVPLVCCGERMKELVLGTVDASKEKHVPVYSVDGTAVAVNVGSAAHPMQDVHYIEWIAVETERGIQLKRLKPNEAPAAVFTLADGEEVQAVYAYCNLHGLWKA